MRPKAMPIFPGLIGKVALITGASGEIGGETARYLAANMARVVVSGRNHEKLTQLVAQIEQAGGSAMPFVADCTKATEVDAMRRAVDAKFGGVDLLIAFAGGGTRIEPIEQLDDSKWSQTLDANLTSKFLTVKSFVPGMKRRGTGAIVLMSSSAGRAPSEATLPYSCAQAGVTVLVKNLAQQLGKHGIRVNALAPSAVRNERMERFMTADQQAELAASFPLSRIGEPYDVAAATLFLCSEASSWITGVTLDISGGKVM